MNRYMVEFAKDGYMKYISHLDLTRLFKNAFKKAGIKLVYSHGYNPHPKMSFAQPLSLGYSSSCEVVEFETEKDMTPAEILSAAATVMPEGVKLMKCERQGEGKSLASRVFAADYEICIPVGPDFSGDISELCDAFLNRDKIQALKKDKKTNQESEIDIKGKIRTLSGRAAGDEIILYAGLDSGSQSNLSPELLISSFVSFAVIETAREEITVKRTRMCFE